MKGILFVAGAIFFGCWLGARTRRPAPDVKKEVPARRYIYLGSGKSEPNESDKYDFSLAIKGKRAAEQRDRSRHRLHAGMPRRPAVKKNVRPFTKRKTGTE